MPQSSFFLNIFIMLLQLSHPPLYYPTPCTPLPPTVPPFSSCPWVLHINSLASTFPILFNLPLLIFYLPFMLLIFCTFSPSLPSHSPTDNPPCDLHFYDSVPVLVVCLVFFCFCFLGSVVDSCDFVVIFLFIFVVVVLLLR